MTAGNAFGTVSAIGLTVFGLWLFHATSPVFAEEPVTDKQNIAGQAEQTPEQAAGGMKNLLRIRKACEADAKRMCAEVKPGGGRLLKCLHEHEADLSPVCREAVGPRPAKP